LLLYVGPDAAGECEGAEEDDEEDRSPSVAQQDERAGQKHDPRLRTGDWRSGGGERDADRDVLATGQCFGALARES
jgi:hypothetical protein